MTAPIDFTKMKLQPFVTVERKASQYFAYDLAVVQRNDPLWGETLAMVEVSQADGPNFSYWVVFSEALAHPDKMHYTPLHLTLVSGAVLLAFMGKGRRMVVSGLGGGLIHSFIQRRLEAQGLKRDEFSITSIEPDQTVIDLARRHFQFDGDVVLATQEKYLLAAEDKSIDVLCLNSFCQYVDHRAVHCFNDYEEMDHIMSKVSDDGIAFVNCFSYMEDVDLERITRYAESRGYEIDVMNLSQKTSPMNPNPRKIDHYLVLLGKSTVPPTPDGVQVSKL